MRPWCTGLLKGLITTSVSGNCWQCSQQIYPTHSLMLLGSHGHVRWYNDSSWKKEAGGITSRQHTLDKHLTGNVSAMVKILGLCPETWQSGFGWKRSWEREMQLWHLGTGLAPSVRLRAARSRPGRHSQDITLSCSAEKISHNTNMREGHVATPMGQGKKKTTP